MLFSLNMSWIALSGRVRLAKYSVGGFETNTFSVFRFLLLGRASLSTILTLDIPIPSVFTALKLLLLCRWCHVFSSCLCQILTPTLFREFCMWLVVSYRQFLGPFQFFLPVILPCSILASYMFLVPLLLWACGTPYDTVLMFWKTSHPYGHSLMLLPNFTLQMECIS